MAGRRTTRKPKAAEEAPPEPAATEDVTYERVDKVAVKLGQIWRRGGTRNGVRIELVERGSDGSGRITTADGEQHTLPAERLEGPEG